MSYATADTYERMAAIEENADRRWAYYTLADKYRELADMETQLADYDKWLNDCAKAKSDGAMPPVQPANTAWISDFLKKEIVVEFPFDMLWQEADPDNYDADTTEAQYLDAVESALFKAGFNTNASFSNVVTMRSYDDDGNFLDGSDYDRVRGVIDSVAVNYIEMPEIEED